MQCDLGAHHLAYDVSGPEDRPAVLLSHCFAGNRHVWDAQLPALSAYRVIRYDARGHGDSGLPPGPYRLDDLADDAVGLLDALGIAQAHVFGISMGGRTARRLALRYPNRVASLGLITTSYMADAAERQSRMQRVAAVQRDGVAPQHDHNMSRWFTEQALRDQLPGVRVMSAAYLAFSPRAFEWISHAILHDVDDADKLQSLTMPTLIVASPDDPGVPRQASEYMRDAIPNAEFHWLGPAKHLATLEHPERFNQILVDFLARRAG